MRQGCVCASVQVCGRGEVTVCVTEDECRCGPDLRLAKTVVVGGCEEVCA